LEKKVAERTAELDQRNRGMRLVLDNVSQGFITVDLDGVMAPERSSIVDRWFGAFSPTSTFADYVCAPDTATANWFNLGLQSIKDDMLPRELLVDQLPKRLVRDDRTMSMAYTFIGAEGGPVERILVVLTDITDELAREAMERDSHEMVRIFQRISSDRAGAEQFFSEADALELYGSDRHGPGLGLRQALSRSSEASVEMVDLNGDGILDLVFLVEGHNTSLSVVDVASGKAVNVLGYYSGD
jgi:hypothetical protein